MAHLLGGERLHLSYPNRTIFEGLTIGVHEGDRIGIVGRNGDGKSSLLGMLAGTIAPDDGQVTVRGGVSVGVLDQADVFDSGSTVGQAIVGDTPEYEWAGDARVRDVIDGLCADLDWDAKVADLSGGQRRRVALARVLTGDWDILMLDEPTNHLDVEAISWLAKHLKNRWPADQGALLAITHDRWFLDEIALTTWEVHDGDVDVFEGGYAAYILQRVERDRQNAVTWQKNRNLARKELAWLRRGAPARTAKPKFRIDAANELIETEPEIRDAVALKSMAVSRLGKQVVDLIGVGVKRDGRRVLSDVDWLIAPGERTGILGVNGSGKSTLLSLIAGELDPDEGQIKTGKTVKVRVLTQRIDELEQYLDVTVREVIGRLRTSYTVGAGSKSHELTPSQLLEKLGFKSAHLSTPVKDLSGGQQRRLQLLLVLLDEPNVLILDEPTNDMDTDMLVAIEDLLDSWPGTLLVVSHDRYFIERVTDQQYAINGGTLRHLPGGIEEYLKLPVLHANGEAAPNAQGDVASSHTSRESTPTALSGSDRRQAEKELSAVERKLTRLGELATSMRDDLAKHDQSDYEGLALKMREITAIESEVDELEEKWLQLGEALA